MITRRTRIVSFRISDQEYEELIGLCAVRQARTVSEYARLATLGQCHNATAAQPQEALRDVYRRLRLLDGEVKRLANLIKPHDVDSVLSTPPAGPAQPNIE